MINFLIIIGTNSFTRARHGSEVYEQTFNYLQSTYRNNSYNYATRTFRPRDLSFPNERSLGTFAPGTVLSRELSFPRYFVPGTFVPMNISSQQRLFVIPFVLRLSCMFFVVLLFVSRKYVMADDD